MTTTSYCGYARVSTGEQTLNAQKDALRAAGFTEIFSDVASGAKTDRTGLEAAMAALQSGDTLVVARLDRLGRSMPHLVATVHELAARGVGFKSLAESIDYDLSRQQTRVAYLRLPRRLRARAHPGAYQRCPRGQEASRRARWPKAGAQLLEARCGTYDAR